MEVLERHNRDGDPFEIEYRFRAKDGRWTWVGDHATAVRDADGSIAFSQGVMFDVTERRQAEEQLREAEERYRALVEAAPAVVYRMGMDETWPLLFVSPSAGAVLGEPPEWWTDPPRSWRSFIHPDDRETVDRNTVQAVETGETFAMEYRVVRPDGETMWIFDNAILIGDEKGEPRYWQGIFVDLSTQKELEEARRESEGQLRDAEQRYRAIVEHVPAAIYVDVPDGSMATTYVSPQIEQIMGCTPEEFMADPNLWLERMPDERQRSELRESYLRAIEERRTWIGEYWIRHPDGREVWVHDETTFVTDEDGEPLFLQGVMYDMTERKLAQQALEASERREREAAERLRTLDEMKNTFLAAVSHELRSPLTSILGLTLTLERHQFPEDERVDLLGRLAANARKLDRLLKDLLDIDRLSRGIVTPTVRPTDIAAIVDRTVESLDVLGERSILVQTERVVIPVDPPKIERIVENLVMNAVRHTQPDVGIWVRVWPEEAGAVIAVEDDGPGVPRDLRSEIFEPFRQGPTSATAHSPGTGIGLSLVAMFAELHGGRAWVQDREGGGASFRVFLPATGPDPSDAERDADEAAPVGSRTRG
jgi:PAS domain S-box-containing protein